MASFFPEWSQAIPNDQERFLENKAGHVHGYQYQAANLPAQTILQVVGAK